MHRVVRWKYQLVKNIKVKWTGIRPLVMHNGQLADPMNAYTKQIKALSDIRKKTDSDYEEMSWVEFQGGFYWDDEEGPVMPSNCIEACIRAGAKKSRLGKEIQSAVLVSEEVVPVNYSGPRSMKAMFEDPRFVLREGVKVKTSRVMRTRPMIPTGWSISFLLDFDDTVINEAALKKAMVDAGALLGLCDWRPKFGRFVVS